MPKEAAKKGAKKTHPRVVTPKDASFSSLRTSLKPGTICIMLAGRFRGRRCVMLKQLPKNGPIVVTGPMKLNGVPLRRVNPSYVIATKTSVDVTGINTDKVNNDLFKRAAAEKRTKGDKDFMGDKKTKTEGKKGKVSKGPNGGMVSQERFDIQKTVDTAVRASLKKDPMGKAKAGYLRSVFTVKPGDMPHRMQF